MSMCCLTGQTEERKKEKKRIARETKPIITSSGTLFVFIRCGLPHSLSYSLHSLSLGFFEGKKALAGWLPLHEQPPPPPLPPSQQSPLLAAHTHTRRLCLLPHWSFDCTFGNFYLNFYTVLYSVPFVCAVFAVLLSRLPTPAAAAIVVGQRTGWANVLQRNDAQSAVLSILVIFTLTAVLMLWTVVVII